MTKKELVEVLEQFNDDQYVYVGAFNPETERVEQLVIQAIEKRPPWHDAKEDQSNWLIALCVHKENGDLSKPK